ncbi:MAG: transporter substrate-binding domain-containing protein [Candidatus Bathyarchaeota archaeon]|nr:MAG: transporter substrate-binding domain-containing protein [Candidatus Bathyarchaeota archaeon]
MAMSKGTYAAIVVVAIVAFIVGVYSHPMIFPPAEEPEAPEDPVWASVSESGVIRVGSSPDWPPYEFLEEGEFAGFEVDLMEMIADELNLEVEWVEMGFDLIIPEVQDQTIDLGVSGFSVKPERMEVVQFTMHHSVTEGQIIMLESRRAALGITEIATLEELVALDLSCAVQVGTTQQAELLEKAPGALETYEDYLVAMEDLKRGAVDCVYAEVPVTTLWIQEAEAAGEEALVVFFRRPYYPVAFVAHRDADILVEKINGALSEMIAEGELDELKAEWIP